MQWRCEILSNVNWLQIKNEYINTTISYRKLADKHGVSPDTLTRRAIKEKWSGARKVQYSKTMAKVQRKTADAVSTVEANRIKRLMGLSDRLIDKLEKATEQLDTHLVTNKVKVKQTVYGNKDSGEPTTETTTETEKLAMVDGIIDRLGLKQLASALKDIKEIQTALEEKKADTSLMEALLGVVKGGD